MNSTVDISPPYHRGQLGHAQLVCVPPYREMHPEPSSSHGGSPPHPLLVPFSPATPDGNRCTARPAPRIARTTRTHRQ